MDDIDYSPPSPPITINSFFTPLLISMLGIVSTSMAIALYHLILVKYCMRRDEETSGRALPSPPASDGEPAAKGVEEKILKTIPILCYSTQKGNLFRIDQTECVICLGELEDGDMVRLLPNCMHAFHVPCIDKWFTSRTSCPVCRSPIVAPVRSTPGDGIELNVVGDFDVDASASAAAPPRGLLRRCASSAVPMERRSRRLVMGLKRSLSMDQSHVIVEIQRESDRASSSSSSKARSIRHLDRVSSTLLRSFSRLRMGRGSEASGILPY
uniref:RING-type E3 ubiquitin transferase n=1 Tax=Davidia involucrata TaxID=16924 RepID=A0A5B6YXZ8_DAVIN